LDLLSQLLSQKSLVMYPDCNIILFLFSRVRHENNGLLGHGNYYIEKGMQKVCFKQASHNSSNLFRSSDLGVIHTKPNNMGPARFQLRHAADTDNLAPT